MKNLNFIISIVFLLNCSLHTFGQDNVSKSNIALDRGINMYEQKNYKEAESYLKKSINYYPQFKGYYYMALTQFQLNDTCQACNYFFNAVADCEKKYKKQYDTLCFKYRRIYYQDDTACPSIFYSDYKTDVCTKKTQQDMKIKDRKTGNISTFLVTGYDSLATSDLSFFIKHPDLQNITSAKILFTRIKNMPEYTGSHDEMCIFFFKNYFKSPLVKKNKDVVGTILASFIVETDGTLSTVKVVKTIEGVVDSEVIRIIAAMPDWVPGMIGTTVVRVQLTIPITFK